MNWGVVGFLAACAVLGILLAKPSLSRRLNNWPAAVVIVVLYSVALFLFMDLTFPEGCE